MTGNLWRTKFSTKRDREVAILIAATTEDCGVVAEGCYLTPAGIAHLLGCSELAAVASLARLERDGYMRRGYCRPIQGLLSGPYIALTLSWGTHGLAREMVSGKVSMDGAQ